MKPNPEPPPAIGTQHPGLRMCHNCEKGYIKAAVDGDYLCPACLPFVQIEQIRKLKREKLIARDQNQCNECGKVIRARLRYCEKCRKERAKTSAKARMRKMRDKEAHHVTS